MQTGRQHFNGSARAFTLVETVMSLVVVAVMLTTLYAAFAFGFGTIRLARQDLRATQILLQRMETLRLTSFTNIQSGVFTEYYDEVDKNTGGGGVLYTITIATNMPGATEMQSPVYYLTNILKITARATWTNGNQLRTRTMQTYASRKGIQSYVYSPQQQ